MKHDLYDDLSLSDLRTRHRRLVRAAIEGHADCDGLLELADEVERKILKRPANTVADAVIKLSTIREGLASGGRTDGADLKALDQVMRLLQASEVSNVRKFSDHHDGMRLHA